MRYYSLGLLAVGVLLIVYAVVAAAAAGDWIEAGVIGAVLMLALPVLVYAARVSLRIR